jgi:hypothetical protein
VLGMKNRKKWVGYFDWDFARERGCFVLKLYVKVGFEVFIYLLWLFFLEFWRKIKKRI